MTAAKPLSHFDKLFPEGNNFGLLRLILALLVVFSHSYSLAWGSEDAEPLMRLTHGRLGFASLAVNGFFVLSGFLVTHSFLRSRGFFDYLKKRILRIYPGFIAVSLIGVVIFGFL